MKYIIIEDQSRDVVQSLVNEKLSGDDFIWWNLHGDLKVIVDHKGLMRYIQVVVAEDD